MKRTTLAAVGTALTLTACGDGQTESGYRGEPLMSLRGVVTSSQSALSEDLVPALSFLSLEDFAMGASPGSYFVKGEVEGTFPSSFTLRVYDPAPQAALSQMFDGEPAFNIAHIAAVSPDVPNSLRKKSYDEAWEENGVEIGRIQRDELCSDTGDCISGYPSECPEGEQDPSREWPCGATFPEGRPWEIYGYSDDYSVAYFDGDVAAGSVLSKLYGDGASIAGGYHAMRFIAPETLSADEQAARSVCVNDAQKQAIEEANAIYGTAAVYPDISELGSLDRQLKLISLQMAAQAELGCQSLWDMIADPASEPIELPFTDQPQRVLW